MATDNIERSYGDTSIKDDVVLNAVEILTAQETQIMNLVKKSVAIALVHSYLTDTLAAVGSQAVAETGDYTNQALTTPSRLTNVVEHVAFPFRVSRAQQKAQHYHGQDEKERQTQKALKSWANAAEFDFLRSTLVSGASGTVPKMSGVIEAVSKSTNHTSHNSGTVWAASILDGLMQANWDNSNGDVASALFMGSVLRTKTDGFTQKSNVVVNAPGISSIIKTVSTYETAMGTLKLYKHRYMYQSGDATNAVLAINPDKIAVAWFEKPYIDTDLARAGAYDSRAVAGSMTAEIHNKDSNFYADGFLLT